MSDPGDGPPVRRSRLRRSHLGHADGQNPAEVFDALLARGDIQIHASDIERVHALTTLADVTGTTGDEAERLQTLVVADTREHVAALNAAIRDRRQTDQGHDDGQALTTAAGERIGVGDTITTRRNDRTLGVANRQTWTVTGIADDGGLTIACESLAAGPSRPGTQGGTRPAAGHRTGTKPQVSRGERTLPAAYVQRHVELAYARTVYGAQGETVDQAHFVLGEQTGAASAYVAMTRGRSSNTAHLVAESVDEAREQWVGVFSRDRADLGPARAATRAAEGPRPLRQPGLGDRRSRPGHRGSGRNTPATRPRQPSRATLRACSSWPFTVTHGG